MLRCNRGWDRGQAGCSCEVIESFGAKNAGVKADLAGVSGSDDPDRRYRQASDLAPDFYARRGRKPEFVIFSAVKSFVERCMRRNRQRGTDLSAYTGFSAKPGEVEGKAVAEVHAGRDAQFA